MNIKQINLLTSWSARGIEKKNVQKILLLKNVSNFEE